MNRFTNVKNGVFVVIFNTDKERVLHLISSSSAVKI